MGTRVRVGACNARRWLRQRHLRESLGDSLFVVVFVIFGPRTRTCGTVQIFILCGSFASFLEVLERACDHPIFITRSWFD